MLTIEELKEENKFMLYRCCVHVVYSQGHCFYAVVEFKLFTTDAVVVIMRCVCMWAGSWNYVPV